VIIFSKRRQIEYISLFTEPFSELWSITCHMVNVNSDHPTTNCCPSQQTTQCLPAVRSAQLHLVFGTVYQLPFEQHPLPTHFNDTSRLTFSPATPPSTNCYHPCLRFELLFWHMARYKCRLLTYLLMVSHSVTSHPNRLKVSQAGTPFTCTRWMQWKA